MADSKKRNLAGWIKEPEDSRDYPFKTSLKVEDLPEMVDLRPMMSKPDDQKTIGSCVPHSAVGALEYYENLYGMPYEDLSRLYLYWTTRVLQKDLRDTGCSIRMCLKAISKNGCCKESLWVYDCRRYRTSPPQKCYNDAVRYKNVTYYRVSTINEIKSALAEGNPVLFGAYLYPSFYDAEDTGEVPMPGNSEECIGGHCMLLSGFLDGEKKFIVRNSWGTRFGGKMRGYCKIPYAYIADKSLCGDFWVLKLIEGA